MQALWGEPWTAPSVFVDGNEVAPFRGDVIDLWLLAKQCTVTQWRQGLAERRRNGGTAQGSIKHVHFDVEDSIPRIGCFLSAFEHLFRTLPKELSQSTATEIESWSLDANRRSLVCEWRVKKDRTLVKKPWSSLSQRAAEHPVQWGKKQRTGLWHRHPFERRSSSIKARRRQSRSTGFARDFGWIVAGTKPSGRTLDLYIYIYIANGESPSQHVTVGLAEARPNNNLRQGLLFLYVYFLFSIFHPNRPKKSGKESRVLQKPIIFCAMDLIHTVGNKWDHNKALLKFWRESDKRVILFFSNKKKNIRNGIHCTCNGSVCASSTHELWTTERLSSNSHLAYSPLQDT